MVYDHRPLEFSRSIRFSKRTPCDSIFRQDAAPDHPEISLTAVYRFYEKLPYFKFYSEMQIVEEVWLELLRNDEMTMDSMFTDLAFQRPAGEIVDVSS